MLLVLLATLAHAGDLDFGTAVQRALSEGAGAGVVAASADLARAEADAGARAGEDLDLRVEQRPDETSLTAGVALPLGGGPLARRRAAALAREAATHRQTAERLAVAVEAGNAYLDALRAREHARHAREARALALRVRDAVTARLAAGEGTRAAAALERAQAAHALALAATAEAEAAAAVERLGALVGQGDVQSLGGWPDLPVPPTTTSGDAPPDLRAARAAAQAADAQRAVASRLTTVHLEGGWTVGDAAGPVVGASLAFPLTGERSAARRAARADATRARAEELRLTLSLDAETAAAHADVHAADAADEAWRIEGLDTLLVAAAQRHEAGETSLADYVAERDLALDALRGATDARWRRERARLAAWALRGELPPTPTPPPEAATEAGRRPEETP